MLWVILAAMWLGGCAGEPAPPAASMSATSAAAPPCAWHQDPVPWPTVAQSLAEAPLQVPTAAQSAVDLIELSGRLHAARPVLDFPPSTGPIELPDVAVTRRFPEGDRLSPVACRTVAGGLDLEPFLALADLPATAQLSPSLPAANPAEGRRVHDVAARFDSPWTGPFVAWVDLPVGDVVGVAIVRLGHDDSLVAHRARVGDGLLVGGWAQVVVQARLYDDLGAEDRVARRWLRAGSSLLSVRLVETVIAAAWARQQPWSKGRPMGLVGHSGGGAAVCLLPRVHPGFDFVVTDLCSDFLPGAAAEQIGDDYNVALRRYWGALGDLHQLDTPSLKVQYGYPDGAPTVLRWLEAHPWRPEP